MHVIQQSIVIRDTAENIYTALTSREDLARWWRAINAEADGVSVWYGLDRTYPVPIIAANPGVSIAFAFEAHHPYDDDRTEPTTITISIVEEGDYSIVTVLQALFSEEQWNTLVNDGWVYSLLSLFLWVERGVALSDWMDPHHFHTVERIIPVDLPAQAAFAAFTDQTSGAPLFAESDPGRDVLRNVPRNIVRVWEDRVQVWTVVPANHGSVLRIQEYGHDRKKLNNTALRYLEREWTKREATLKRLGDITPE